MDDELTDEEVEALLMIYSSVQSKEGQINRSPYSSGFVVSMGHVDWMNLVLNLERSFGSDSQEDQNIFWKLKKKGYLEEKGDRADSISVLGSLFPRFFILKKKGIKMAKQHIELKKMGLT